MVKDRDRHRNSWQPMWWASMHPRDQSFFFWGGSSQCVPIKFPLSSQHSPQVPNVFPIAPHFIWLYSLFEICSLTHNRNHFELFSRIPQLFYNGSHHTSYVLWLTIETTWNCLVEYHNCFTMVLIIQVMKNRTESLKQLRRQNDMQGRFNTSYEESHRVSQAT
jgi:hypothetical protein